MKTGMICLATVAAMLLATTQVSALSMRSEDFSSDPGWTGVNNLPPLPHGGPDPDYGYSAGTTNAGGGPGEAGGFITRAHPANSLSFYADTTGVGPLTLNDVLEMNWTGAPALYSSDQLWAEMYLGFFNSSLDFHGIFLES